jgi:hypothetical protein
MRDNTITGRDDQYQILLARHNVRDIPTQLAERGKDIDMTRRALTTMGSATAIAAMVGGCLMLGPTPQAQAGTICDSSSRCVTFGSGSITATSGGNKAVVDFMNNLACATPAGGMQQCKPIFP